MRLPKIFLAINYVNYSDVVKKHNQSVAISVLDKIKTKNVTLASINFLEDKVSLPNSFNVFRMLKKDSRRDLGDSRRMPYIKEIFDLCSKTNCDIFGYINSDILLKKDFFNSFNDIHDAFVFYKRDIEKVSTEDFLNCKIKIVNKAPDGCDGFFFKKSWWLKNGDIFPKNLILGESEWDTCYNSIIQKTVKDYVLKRELCHVVHERIWKTDSIGAKNNTLIWNNIRDKYGLPVNNPKG